MTYCGHCQHRFDGVTCPRCHWDSRYGSIKNECGFKGCGERPAWRALDPNRPRPYRSVWCAEHRQRMRGEFEPFVEVRAVESALHREEDGR